MHSVRLIVLIITLAMLPAFGVACAGSQQGPAARAFSYPEAFDSAVLVLNTVDHAEAAYLRSLESPTPEQLQDSQARVDRLKEARDVLREVRALLDADDNVQDRLRVALSILRIAVSQMKEGGLPVPPEADRALGFAELWIESRAL